MITYPKLRLNKSPISAIIETEQSNKNPSLARAEQIRREKHLLNEK
ncbi:MAG: hypothetical protein FWG63_09000 [Defluviitaleaceae bacterium]|nr:hypothetical protein [Defluviitaleaceae bacterium]